MVQIDISLQLLFLLMLLLLSIIVCTLFPLAFIFIGITNGVGTEFFFIIRNVVEVCMVLLLSLLLLMVVIGVKAIEDDLTLGFEGDVEEKV